MNLCNFVTGWEHPTHDDAVHCYRLSSVVCRSVTLVIPAKTAEPIEMLFGLRTWMGAVNHVLDGVQISPSRGNFGGKEEPVVSIGSFCHQLCENGWTDEFAIWIVDSDGLKEAQVQSYSTGGANVPIWLGTLVAPTAQYDWTCASFSPPSSDAVLCQITLTTCFKVLH